MSTSFIIPSFREKARHDFFEVRCSDFDGASFFLKCTAEDPQKLTLAMSVPCWADLQKLNCDKDINEIYSAFTREESKEFDTAVSIDLEDAEDLDTVANLLTGFKRNVLAVPLNRVFNSMVNSSETVKPMTINYREREQLFIIQKSEEKAVVIFSLNFEDKVDRCLAQVFATEFAEAHRTVDLSPTFRFFEIPEEAKTGGEPSGDGKVFPAELKVCNPHPIRDSDIGYLVCSVDKMHLNTEAKKEEMLTLLLGLRSYMNYHIKASKSHLHTIMRGSCVKLLKVKTRCKPKTKIFKKFRPEIEGEVDDFN